MNAMFGLTELLLLVPMLGISLMMGLGLLAIGFWIWMLVECVSKESSTGNDKLVWVLILVFTHVLGAVLYWLIRRPRRKAELGA